MRAIPLWLALLAAPYWEAKPPQEWSDRQLHQMLSDSPWAQGVEKSMVAYLATARPIQEAEQELMRRKGTGPPDPEYANFLEKNQGRHLVLAVAFADSDLLENPSEVGRMEAASVLKIGRKTHKMAGFYPPLPTDPFVRLVFPREIGPNDKSLVFELYLPGTGIASKFVEFRVKDLVYHGKPEM